MLVRFWGTRGSLAKPGDNTRRYGGNTSCVELRSAAGTVVVIDCGTGAHDLGHRLRSTISGPIRGHLLISHTHWDHIQGIPFFQPLFDSKNVWDIYAPHSMNQSLQETLAGQMRYTYFPIALEALGAKIRYHDLVEGTFTVGDITVRARYLNHTALTLGYRFEGDGCSVVYSCDHEPFPRGDRDNADALGAQNQRHANFLHQADLVIHDAQYTADQFPEKSGWGHSSAEYAVEVSQAAGARQLALTHHDPLRSDDELDHIVTGLQAKLTSSGSPLQVYAAAEGQCIELEAVPVKDGKPEPEWFSAVESVDSAIAQHTILLAPVNARILARLNAAASAENLRLVTSSDFDEAIQSIQSEQPSVVIVDASYPSANVVALCQAVKNQSEDGMPQAPIIVIADKDQVVPELAGLATDWIVQPFSEEYLRTRLRAWALRSSCRWVRAGHSDNEEARLAALQKLEILDTEPEERFDRIVRLAADVLDVPIALVSLVDRDRQWFKSCVGIDATETHRDMAFCAHAILDNKVLVVPDTLQDSRFAENPLVTGDPRIRFYAGCPLKLPDGHNLGTLCLIDTRPRQLSARQINQLQQFAQLAEQQLLQK